MSVESPYRLGNESAPEAGRARTFTGKPPIVRDIVDD
jgi:hypothetical protein